jgi:transcriptional regulator with XRE-family HTH domain
MTLAERMRKERKRRGINSAAMGALLDLSGRTVEGIEQGREFATPTVLMLALVALENNLEIGAEPVDMIR